MTHKRKRSNRLVAPFFVSHLPVYEVVAFAFSSKTSPHTTKAPPLAPHTPTRPSMRKRSQLVSVTTCTPRDTSGLKHAKPSHQVQPGHKTRRHAPPPAPHATHPGSNTQNRRTRCSRELGELGSQITTGFTQTIGDVLTDHPTANRNARPDEGLESSTLRR